MVICAGGVRGLALKGCKCKGVVGKGWGGRFVRSANDCSNERETLVLAVLAIKGMQLANG